YGMTKSRVALKNRVDQIWLPLEQAVPCGLIINELVSNALKHGFPESRTGTVTVELAALERGHLCLLVDDNGVGLSSSIDPKVAKTLGLQLIVNLVQQIKGDLVIGQTEGSGCCVSVIFPTPCGTAFGSEE
ncbi:MAG TPA: ATP-binding protein, partial [Dissulfurispiraceae bacterium]|nr:ATP-binding protein [Dissulfurispiraceae bacterium]